jgi:hypothetical protein
VPVAAYPVTGPIDVIRQGVTGVLDEDLAAAVRGALQLSREDCRNYALEHTWEASTQQFAGNLCVAQATFATPLAALIDQRT